MNLEKQIVPHAASEEAFLKRLNRGLALLVFVIAVTVFSGTFTADFVHWDDDIQIYNNPHIRSLNWETVSWSFTDLRYIPRYMPLGWLSYAASYCLGGGQPAAFHAINILLHAINSVLVFFLLQRILRLVSNAASRATSARGLMIGSMFGALLWAIHPLRAETVAWASAQIYCQAMLFLLISLWSYLRANEFTGTTRWKWLAASAIAYLASLLTYPIAMMGVAALVLFNFYPLRRLSFSRDGLAGVQARRVWLEHIPFIASTGLVVLITAWARTLPSQYAAPTTLAEFGAISRVMQAFYVWAWYPIKSLLPSNLCPTYTDLYSFKPLSVTFVVAALFIVGVSLLVLRFARRMPAVTIGWFSYLLLLVPMLGLTEHPHITYDRYSYVVSLVLSIAAAGMVTQFWATRVRSSVCMVAASIIAACGLMCFGQTAHWRNTPTLLTYVSETVGHHPVAAKQEHILATEYRAAGDSTNAILHFERALRITPDSATIHAELADMLATIGRTDLAIAHYREALHLEPAHKLARQNFGVILGQLGHFEEALEQFRQLIRADSKDPKAHHNAAITLAQLGRTDEAKIELAMAKELSVPR